MATNEEIVKPEIPESEEAKRKRIDEARKKILKDRDQFKSQAVNITAEILNGTDYTESIVVKLIGGKLGNMTIRPLSEGEMIEIFSKFGQEKIGNIGKEGIEENYEFYWKIVAKSTSLPLDSLKRSLVMGESTLIGDRILEISGLKDDSDNKVGSFP